MHMDQVKQKLAKQIATTLDEREMTQTQASYLMKDAPSQVSLVVTGKLRGFSTDRLLRMLSRLGFDVEIRITERQKGQGAVRLVS